MWLKNNWRWLILNIVGVLVLVYLVRLATGRSLYAEHIEALIESGRWAVRFLLFSLLITPLNTLFGWRSAIPLRKPAGLWAFVFGSFHFGVYVWDNAGHWLQYPIPNYYTGFGVAALVILSLLAATSTKWAMKRMGKNWKRLHRLVYLAGILALVHGLLESIYAKRAFAFDPWLNTEAQIYLILLAILLIARIPFIRTGLASLRYRGLASSS